LWRGETISDATQKHSLDHGRLENNKKQKESKNTKKNRAKLGEIAARKKVLAKLSKKQAEAMRVPKLTSQQ